MELKDPRHFGQWAFYIGGAEESDNPELEVPEIRVPMEGYFNSKKKLEMSVMTELANLAAQGATGYLDSLREEAASYGKKPKDFLSTLIEHQICVRSRDRNMCWSMGLGDKIHSVTEKVDDLMEKAPAPIKKVYQKVVKIVTPKAGVLGRVSSCRSCGGGRSMKISRNNRGRSGRF